MRKYWICNYGALRQYVEQKSLKALLAPHGELNKKECIGHGVQNTRNTLSVHRTASGHQPLSLSFSSDRGL